MGQRWQDDPRISQAPNRARGGEDQHQERVDEEPDRVRPPRDRTDPLEDDLVAAVVESHRKQIKYSCNPCKPSGYTELPCVSVCEPEALSHSW